MKFSISSSSISFLSVFLPRILILATATATATASTSASGMEAENETTRMNIRSLSLSHRNLGREDNEISICHLYRHELCAVYYKTIVTNANAAKGHSNHGDYVNGGCGDPGVCAEICDHQPCFDDYLSGNDICICFGSGPYLCGPNTECVVDGETNDESCECLEGYEDITGGEGASNPNQGCTLTPAPTPAPMPIPASAADGCFEECPDGTSYSLLSDGVDGAVLYDLNLGNCIAEIPLEFSFNWLNDKNISSVWLSKYGLIYPSENDDCRYCEADPIEIGSFTTPRLSFAQYSSDSSGGLVIVKGSSESLTISIQGVTYVGAPSSAQVSLFPDGHFHICYGVGDISDTEDFAAGIEDETINVAYPAVTFSENVFDSTGITNEFPSYKCACFNPDCRGMNE